VVTGASTLHVCYIHTPTRYYWSDYAKYQQQTGFGILSPFVRAVMPRIVDRMRIWDFAAAQRVDKFVANSDYVAARVKKFYRRDAEVIHPPIDLSRFELEEGPKRGFVVVSRLIPYKRVDLAVQACTQLNLPLTVIGDGSEMEALKAVAGASIKFEGRLSDAEVARVLSQSTAFVFTADEDFGLTPLEAMACGTPVIAFGKGGALETVVPGKTGLFFEEQTVESLKRALQNFDPGDFDAKKIRAHAAEFDEAVFIEKIKKFVDLNLKTLQKNAKS
jgi:glycosyltransferase involved in cell wall biosynthesis